MYSHENFPENLRILRKTHNLSTILLADIVGLKSQVSITKMENGSSTPLYNTYIKIADLFGVSADWLSGRSKNKYVESTICHLESHFFSIANYINIEKNINLIYYIYIVHIILGINYFNLSKKLSLQQRADVIYALNFFKYVSQKLYNDHNNCQKSIEQVMIELTCILNTDTKESSIENQLVGILSKYLPSYMEQIDIITACCSSKRGGTVFSKHYKQCIEILRSTKELGPFVPPYFDIMERMNKI